MSAPKPREFLEMMRDQHPSKSDAAAACKDGVKSLDDAKQLCDETSECSSFWFKPSDGRWCPKKSYDPSPKNSAPGGSFYAVAPTVAPQQRLCRDIRDAEACNERSDCAYCDEAEKNKMPHATTTSTGRCFATDDLGLLACKSSTSFNECRDLTGDDTKCGCQEAVLNVTRQARDNHLKYLRDEEDRRAAHERLRAIWLNYDSGRKNAVLKYSNMSGEERKAAYKGSFGEADGPCSCLTPQACPAGRTKLGEGKGGCVSVWPCKSTKSLCGPNANQIALFEEQRPDCTSTTPPSDCQLGHVINGVFVAPTDPKNYRPGTPPSSVKAPPCCLNLLSLGEGASAKNVQQSCDLATTSKEKIETVIRENDETRKKADAADDGDDTDDGDADDDGDDTDDDGIVKKIKKIASSATSSENRGRLLVGLFLVAFVIFLFFAAKKSS